MPKSRFPLLYAVSVCLASLATAGCTELERQRECRHLADAVNPLLDDIEALGARTQPTPKGYVEVAERYRKLKAAVRKMEIKDERLQEAIDAYLDMVTLAEKQLRASAGAATNKEKLAEDELARRHRTAMTPLLAQQGTAIGRLRGLCKP